MFEELLGQADEISPRLKADALRLLGGLVYIVGEFERGRALYEESLALYRSVGDEWWEAHMLHRIAVDEVRVGRLDEARALSEHGLAVARRSDDLRGQAMALRVLGQVEQGQGNDDQAIELFKRAGALAAESGFVWWHGGTLHDLAEIAVETGRLDEARDALLEALPIQMRLGDRLHLVYGLFLLGRVLAEQGREEQAGVLWGAVEAEERRGPIGQWEEAKPEFQQMLARYKGPELERGLELGRRLSLDEAVQSALSKD